MKNKTYISFLINILVGILFSFPVFSAQGSIENCINSNNKEYYSVNQSDTFSESDYYFYSANHLSNYNLSDALPSKLFKTKLTAGKKEKHLSDFSPLFLKDHDRHYYLSNIVFNYSLYVNLSYLKELKTTKMLC